MLFSVVFDVVWVVFVFEWGKICVLGIGLLFCQEGVVYFSYIIDILLFFLDVNLLIIIDVVWLFQIWLCVLGCVIDVGVMIFYEIVVDGFGVMLMGQFIVISMVVVVVLLMEMGIEVVVLCEDGMLLFYEESFCWCQIF